MENPATWKPAEVVIMQAYEEWSRMTTAGAIGPSLPHFIADALRKAGHLNDAADPEVGWEGIREARLVE